MNSPSVISLPVMMHDEKSDVAARLVVGLGSVDAAGFQPIIEGDQHRNPAPQPCKTSRPKHAPRFLNPVISTQEINFENIRGIHTPPFNYIGCLVHVDGKVLWCDAQAEQLLAHLPHSLLLPSCGPCHGTGWTVEPTAPRWWRLYPSEHCSSCGGSGVKHG